MINLPQEAFTPEILARPQFVSWTLTNEGKKIPLDPKNGKGAKANDASTWTTYAQAVTYNGNIGIELGYGIGGIDIDNCFNSDGSLSNMAAEIVQRMNTYTEFSPSGRGLHLLFTYEGSITFSNSKQGRRDSKIGLELYAGAHFLTVTGRPFGEVKPIAPRTAEMHSVYQQYLSKDTTTTITNVETKEHTDKPTKPAPIPQPQQATTATHTHTKDNSRLWQAMFQSSKGTTIKQLYEGDISAYPTNSEADLALANILAFWCKCDKSRMLEMFNETALAHREKWQRSDYQNSTIQEAIAAIHRKQREAFRWYMAADGEPRANKFLAKAFKKRIPDNGQFTLTYYTMEQFPRIRNYPLKQDSEGKLIMPMTTPDGEFQTYITFDNDGNAKPCEGIYIAGAFLIRSERYEHVNTALVTAGLLSAIALAADSHGEADVFCTHSWNNCCAVCQAIRNIYSSIRIIYDNNEAAFKAADWCRHSSMADELIPPQGNARDWHELFIKDW